MNPPRILAIIDAGKRFAHAAYAMEELLRRCAVARTIVTAGKDLPNFADYDGILFYGPQNVAPPESEKPLVHILASTFFGERFQSSVSVPEPPFVGTYPSPAFFNTPKEYYSKRPLDRSITIFDDYVASAYLCLSGHEERVRPHWDEHQRYYGKSSFLFRGGILERALVEDYASEIGAAFDRAGLRIPPRPPWSGGAPMALCLTCDVDLPLRNTWRAFGRALLRRPSIYQADASQPSAFSYLPRKTTALDPYLDLDALVRRTEIPDSAWTFFFLSGLRSKMDAYTLKDNDELAFRARMLEDKGMEASLHAPYECWKSPVQYREALAEFESATGGVKPSGVRQHYLRFQTPMTWGAQAGAGLLYDASAAFACCEGFRFGTALPFRAFDAESEKTLDLWVIPLTVMDVTLRHYREYTPEIAGERMRVLARETKRVGGVFTFLWHNSSVGLGWEKWEETFDTFLHSLAQERVWAPTCSKLIKTWRKVSEPS